MIPAKDFPRKYVIGGGLAGLIFMHYNSDYILIEGREDKEISVPLPQYIYDDESTRELLTELGINFEKRTVHVGIYFVNGWVPPADEIRALYYEKTRGETIEDFPPYTMSMGKTEFDILDVSIQDLREVLRNRIIGRIIHEDVVSIDFEQKYLWTTDYLSGATPYEKVVSTIPAPIFLKIIGWMNELYWLKWKPIFVYSAQAKPTSFIYQHTFDYVLFPGPEVPFYRMTKGQFFDIGIESTQEFDVKKWFPGLEPKSFVMPYGKIVGGCIQEIAMKYIGPDTDEITFFGRYGAWLPQLKIQDVIKAAKAWDIQK